jgi:hypothetical protein
MHGMFDRFRLIETMRMWRDIKLDQDLSSSGKSGLRPLLRQTQHAIPVSRIHVYHPVSFFVAGKSDSSI